MIVVQAFRPVLVTLPPAAPGTPLFEPMRRTVLPAAFVTTFAAPGVAGPTPFQPEPLLVKVPFSWALAEERARKDSKRAAPNRRFRAARQKSGRRAEGRDDTVGFCVVMSVSFSVEFFGRCIFSFQICPGGIGWLRPHSNFSPPISSIPPRAAFRTSERRLFVFTSYINARSELLRGKWESGEGARYGGICADG